MSLLEGVRVSKFFRGLTALHEVDFRVENGEITGLIGPNGAGKTTLFNLISGEFSADRGAIIFDGQDITHTGAEIICRMGIARTYQMVRPFLGLTVLQNVLIGVYFGRKEKVTEKRAREEAETLLDSFSLLRKKEFKAMQLTTGERKRLEIARALATRPRILLLDEVVAGLNPTETTQIMESIREIRRKGVTVFMIEHVMKAVMGLSNRVYVLHHGVKIAEGTPERISVDQAVITAYLGRETGEPSPISGG